MKKLLFLLGEGLAVIILFSPSAALADTSKSSDYQFEESSLGGNGFVGSQSASFQAQGSSGILGLGNSASNNYQINAGNTTTNDPALTFQVNSGAVSLGNFSPGAAATATSTFEVIDYTSYGYVVEIAGTPPTNGSHVIPAMSTAGLSVAGTEQFGINLVANTLPTSLGANPDHGQFGVGSAATGYSTPNNYKFASGDTIATGPKSGGATVYTISYIVNVDDFTPGGNYTSGQTLICVGTY